MFSGSTMRRLLVGGVSTCALALVACESSTPPVPSAGSASPSAAASSPAASSAAPAASAPADDEETVIIVSRSEIRVGGETVLRLPMEPADKLVQIDPLGAKLRAIRTAKNVGERGPVAVIRADPTTPYRLLLQVLYTVGQNGFARYVLATLEGTDEAGQRDGGAPPGRTDKPRPPMGASGPSTDGGVPAGSLHVRLSNHGFTVFVDRSALAPGCSSPAAGKATITVPPKGGEQDTAGLQSCAEKVKAANSSATEVTITAEPETPYREVLAAMAALRGIDGKLFSDVRFGVPPEKR